MSEPENERELLHRVQNYRKMVLLYEALDAEIDALIAAQGGVPENEEYLARYRNLARRRDELQNEIRLLEQQLTLDDDEI
jgi:hypothetical protein